MTANIVNLAICLLGLGFGAYTFVRHLNAFNEQRTDAVNAWLVSVGCLAWSVQFYESLGFVLRTMNYAQLGSYLTPSLPDGTVFAHALFLIFWCGVLLQVQKHCVKVRRRLMRIKQNANRQIAV